MRELSFETTQARESRLFGKYPEGCFCGWALIIMDWISKMCRLRDIEN
jgi:hypothetical protein